MLPRTNVRVFIRGTQSVDLMNQQLPGDVKRLTNGDEITVQISEIKIIVPPRNAPINGGLGTNNTEKIKPSIGIPKVKKDGN